jgi:23S rRNA pseudouridine955/2504/2580 synthase
VEVLWGSGAPRCCLLRARPRTGRWHQIRLHAARAGFPVIGDVQHGDNADNRAWREERGLARARLALHMHALTLPALGIDVRCPLPADLRALVAQAPWAAAAAAALPELFAEPEAAAPADGIR